MNRTKDVQRILRRHDPVELISGGAPKDEYDYIADILLALSEGCNDEKMLGDLIYGKFVSLFSEDIVGERDRYVAIARDILAVKSR